MVEKKIQLYRTCAAVSFSVQFTFHIAETETQLLTVQFCTEPNLISYLLSLLQIPMWLPQVALKLELGARICKSLWSPGFDSDGPIPPAYVAWRAGTTNRVVVQAHHAGNRRLVSGQKHKKFYQVQLALKGQFHEIFSFMFFHESSSIRFLIKIVMWFQFFRSQGAPPGVVVTGGHICPEICIDHNFFATVINDTGGKLPPVATTAVANLICLSPA
jgi:hypothetical protein